VDRDKPLGNKPKSHAVISAKWNTAKSNKWVTYLEKSNTSYMKYQNLLETIHSKDSDKAELKLNSLINNRLCKTPDEYDSYMTYKFYGKDECPLKHSCLKHSKQVKKAVTDLLETVS
jgi:hypothetical protein